LERGTKAMTYVYCVLKAGRRPATGRVPRGLPGAAPPRVLPAGRGTWLVVADVPSRLYGAAAIDRGLKTLEWVAPRAVAHEAVIEHFTGRFDVVPMKLFTIFTSDERAVEHVAANPELASIFKRVSGAAEWTVRLQRAAIDEPRSRLDDRRDDRRSIRPESGAAFLRRKRWLRDEERAAAAEARALVGRIYAALARIARAGVQKETSMPGATVLLDAVFLVPRARHARFQAAIQRAARAAAATGGELVLSGPWPPYHFVGAQSPQGSPEAS
jgi:hypothetical protein